MALQEDMSTPAAALSTRQRQLLSQIAQDIRATASHISLPKVSPLAALDATAVDALKDLYYMVNTEDPLNAMPARQHVLKTHLPTASLLPIVAALHADSASTSNPKRWSVATYHTLRLLSVLTLPITPNNDTLHPGCTLDVELLELRASLAKNRPVLVAFVALLQYYIERKVEKQAALASAEESKLEDARIDNILRFFRNLLSPPRNAVGPDVMSRDPGVHLALIGSLVHADLFATLSILFSSPLDAHSQYTDLVFLVADIYALAYRHTTPRQMHRSYLNTKNAAKLQQNLQSASPTEKQPEPSRSVFQDPPNIPVQKTVVKRRNASAGLRAALQRERTLVGGSRAVRASARWTSRHSGGFCASISAKTSDAPEDPSASTNQQSTNNPAPSLRRIISANDAIQSKISFNPKLPFQKSIDVNSQILCLLAAKGRGSRKPVSQKGALMPMRKDLQDDGVRAIVTLTIDLVDMSFEYLLRELRERIEETRQRSQTEESEALVKAQHSLLAIVGSVVGFQRERYGKVYRFTPEEKRSPVAEINENCMKSVLSSDFKIVRCEWKAVEAGIELKTFQLVFRILVDSFEALKESGKDPIKVKTVELSTFAVLEMIRMLQGMAANKDLATYPVNDEKDGDKTTNLTPREIALNTLEELFERESFLNAPADLAKDFNIKHFSFQHLTNIVEVVHAFTTILLDEEELARLQVTKKKKKKTKKVEETKDEEEEIVPTPPQNTENEEDAQVSVEETAGKEVAEEGTPEKSSRDEAMRDLDRDKVENGMNGPSDEVKTEASGQSEPKAMADKTNEKEEKLDGETSSVKAPNTDADGGKAENNSEKLSAVQKMLLADAEGEAEKDAGNGEKVVSDGDGEKENEGLSKAQRMLLADRQTEPDKKIMAQIANEALAKNGVNNQEEKEVTPIERMLAADAEAGPSRPEDVAGKPRTNADSDLEDSEEEPELREVESIGIVRRFAHARALQTLMFPIRAAICNASSLSGAAYCIPDGSEVILAPVIVAKSVHIMSAIWRVAKMREKGALCGQFFSYGTMHLIGIALSSASKGKTLKNSVMDAFSRFGEDVTEVFFTWLNINPGLALDMMFVMDKGSCHMYTRHKSMQEEARIAVEDSGNESDLSLGIKRKLNGGEQRAQTVKRSRKKRSGLGKREMQKRRRSLRDKIEDDEDVDVDNWNIGIGDDSGSESSVGGEFEGKERKRKGRFKKKITDEDDCDKDSDRDGDEAGLNVNGKTSDKIGGSKGKRNGKRKAAKVPKNAIEFSSDDEYPSEVEEE